MITLYETEQELRKDPKTLCAVRDFLLCSNEEIFTILTLLQTEKTDGFITTKNEKGKLKPLSYGYYSFQQPKKKKGEFRTITIPDDRIKEAHTTIALRADKISLSTAAIGGEKGFDIIKNAKYHRYNQYMYAIDLKDAFPSVTTERVYTNISSSLSKIFQYSYPYLKKDQRSLLALTITYIITHLNQLPQGTKTSMKLLNVVMASVDQMVISYIHDPKNFFLDPAYTRYADDAVMSYRDLGGVQEYLDTILLPQRYAILPIIESGSLDELQQIVIKGTGLQQLLHDIFNSNSFSRTSEFAKLLSNIKDKLFQRGTKSNNNKNTKRLIDDRITNTNITTNKVQKYKGRGLLDTVQQDINKIFRDHGRTIHPEKEHLRYPGSHEELREVTGITIDAHGELGVPKRNMDKYINFMRTLIQKPEEIGIRFSKNNELHIGKIRKSLTGTKNHIERIRGKENLPSDYKYRYEKSIAYLKQLDDNKKEISDKSHSKGEKINDNLSND